MLPNLLSDITVNNKDAKYENFSAINIGKAITIDGKGHSITGKDFTTATTNSVISITNFPTEFTGTVTLKNLTVTADGKAVKHCINVYGTTAVLENITVNMINGSNGYAVISNGANGVSNVTIKGEGTVINAGTWGALNVDQNNGSSITLEAGTVNGLVYVERGSFTMTGGAVTSANAVAVRAKDSGFTSAATISGGKVSGNIAKVGGQGTETLSVTGGTFTVDPTAYVAEGYYASKNSGTPATWTVKELSPVMVTLASDGSVAGFETLEEAFVYNEEHQAATAANKNVIKMYEDFDYSNTYTTSFSLYVNLTNTVFDLNQHTFKVYGVSAVCYYGSDFKICNGTATDSRTLNDRGYAIRLGNYGPTKETEYSGPYKVTNAVLEDLYIPYGGINCCNATNVTIKNCEAHAKHTSRYAVCAQDCSNVVIESGTYYQESANSYGIICDWYAYSIKITGGTFVKKYTSNNSYYNGQFVWLTHYTGQEFINHTDNPYYYAVDSSKYTVSRVADGTTKCTWTVTTKDN